jgi:hypothetical protein
VNPSHFAPAGSAADACAIAPGCLAAVWFCICILGLVAVMVLARGAAGASDRLHRRT